jgi:Heterokaryon incompatibility protein (HET)
MAYVWIDSICIIQGDDSQDWIQEAGKMAEYYQRSLLTIAATLSSQEGLFSFQPPIFKRRLARLPYRGEDGVQ